MAMKQLVVLFSAVVLALPALALAGDRATGDGSLAVTSANGKLIVQGNGLIYGHFDAGTLIVTAYNADNPGDLASVSGAKARYVGSTTTYTGSDVRFVFPSGKYLLQFNAGNINFSAVGSGFFTAVGWGTPDDGNYSVNGGHAVEIQKTGQAARYGTLQGLGVAISGKTSS